MTRVRPKYVQALWGFQRVDLKRIPIIDYNYKQQNRFYNKSSICAGEIIFKSFVYYILNTLYFCYLNFKVKLHMKKIGFVLVLSSFLLIFGKAYSQNTPEEIAAKFFATLKEKGIDKAYEYLSADKKTIETNQDMLTDNKNGFVELTKNLGTYYGYDFITKDETGKSYVRYNYMLKYEKSPVKFTIIYYKPNDIWKVFEVIYNKQVDDKIPFNRQMPLKNIR